MNADAPKDFQEKTAKNRIFVQHRLARTVAHVQFFRTATNTNAFARSVSKDQLAVKTFRNVTIIHANMVEHVSTHMVLISK
jgi:hypothetical protein